MTRIAAAGALLLAGCASAAPMALPAGDTAPVVPAIPAPVFDKPAMQGGLVRGHAAPGVIEVTIDGRLVPLASDGAFLLGFDRDAPPTALLVQRSAVAALDTTIAVAPRAWAIERVDAPYRAGKTDAEFAAARPAELAAIVVARATRTDAQGWRQVLSWPAVGRLSGRFGAQRVYQGRPGSYHSGDDIAAPIGAEVSSPADGIVILAADHPFTLEGNLLMIDHGMGLNSALLHLSRIDVRVGDAVRQGQVVGAVGRTGRVTGPHLHWSLQWQGAKLDPSLVAGQVAAR